MVEITYEEQNKVKRVKTEDSLRDLWDNIKCTNIRIIGVQKKMRKRKGMRKYLKRIIVENFPNMEKEIVNQAQEAYSPIQNKPKEKHTKTHTNQTNKE